MVEPKIHEVGMRDGLQMETLKVPIETKEAWLRGLMNSGIDILQLGSFVHPVRVPQMADTDELFKRLIPIKNSAVVLSGLVLNEKGLERGLACGVELFCMGVSASDTHSRKNTGMGTDEALTRIIAMAKTAQGEGISVQVSVQSAFGCGYEGTIPTSKVLGIVDRYLEEGLTNISLADTAGHADPRQVTGLFRAIFELGNGVECTCHFHNTYGMGLANCIAAMDCGVSSFESSVAGLGGCPFTAVAGGNVCTEDLIHMFKRTGLCHRIDLSKIIDTAREVAEFFDREMPGSIYKTGPIP